MPEPDATFTRGPEAVIHEKNSRVRSCELEHFHPPDSPYILLTILADQATGFHRTFSLSPCFNCFSISAGSCDGLTHTVLLELSLLVDAGCNVGTTAFCNTDVGDVGVAELEELVDKTRDNHWYVFRRAALYPSAIFDELWFLATSPLVGISVILAEFSE